MRAVIVAVLGASVCGLTPALGQPPTPGTPPAGVQPGPTVEEADRLFGLEDWAGAALAYEAVVARRPDDARAWFRLGYAWHAAGELDRAIAAHKRAAEFPRYRAVAVYNLACALALQGDVDGALAELERALAAGFRRLDMLGTDPDLHILRKEARFKELVARAKEAIKTDERRRLDFWAGRWTVRDASGTDVGTSEVVLGLDGMLLTEDWTSREAGMVVGRCFAYFDPAKKVWRQIWVDAGGTVIDMTGRSEKGAMRFEGTSTMADGTTELHRSSLEALPDGRVRSFIEESADGGKTWRAVFDLYYTRQAQLVEP